MAAPSLEAVTEFREFIEGAWDETHTNGKSLLEAWGADNSWRNGGKIKSVSEWDILFQKNSDDFVNTWLPYMRKEFSAAANFIESSGETHISTQIYALLNEVVSLQFGDIGSILDNRVYENLDVQSSLQKGSEWWWQYRKPVLQKPEFEESLGENIERLIRAVYADDSRDLSEETRGVLKEGVSKLLVLFTIQNFEYSQNGLGLLKEAVISAFKKRKFVDGGGNVIAGKGATYYLARAKDAATRGGGGNEGGTPDSGTPAPEPSGDPNPPHDPPEGTSGGPEPDDTREPHGGNPDDEAPGTPAPGPAGGNPNPAPAGSHLGAAGEEFRAFIESAWDETRTNVSAEEGESSLKSLLQAWGADRSWQNASGEAKTRDQWGELFRTHYGDFITNWWPWIQHDFRALAKFINNKAGEGWSEDAQQGWQRLRTAFVPLVNDLALQQRDEIQRILDSFFTKQGGAESLLKEASPWWWKRRKNLLQSEAFSQRLLTITKLIKDTAKVNNIPSCNSAIHDLWEFFDKKYFEYSKAGLGLLEEGISGAFLQLGIAMLDGNNVHLQISRKGLEYLQNAPGGSPNADDTEDPQADDSDPGKAKKGKGMLAFGTYIYVWWKFHKEDYEEFRQKQTYPRDRGTARRDVREVPQKPKDPEDIFNGSKTGGEVRGEFLGEKGLCERAKPWQNRIDFTGAFDPETEVIALGVARITLFDIWKKRFNLRSFWHGSSPDWDSWFAGWIREGKQRMDPGEIGPWHWTSWDGQIPGLGERSPEAQSGGVAFTARVVDFAKLYSILQSEGKENIIPGSGSPKDRLKKIALEGWKDMPEEIVTVLEENEELGLENTKVIASDSAGRYVTFNSNMQGYAEGNLIDGEYAFFATVPGIQAGGVKIQVGQNEVVLAPTIWPCDIMGDPVGRLIPRKVLIQDGKKNFVVFFAMRGETPTESKPKMIIHLKTPVEFNDRGKAIRGEPNTHKVHVEVSFMASLPDSAANLGSWQLLDHREARLTDLITIDNIPPRTEIVNIRLKEGTFFPPAVPQEGVSEIKLNAGNVQIKPHEEGVREYEFFVKTAATHEDEKEIEKLHHKMHKTYEELMKRTREEGDHSIFWETVEEWKLAYELLKYMVELKKITIEQDRLRWASWLRAHGRDDVIEGLTYLGVIATVGAHKVGMDTSKILHVMKYLYSRRGKADWLTRYRGILNSVLNGKAAQITHMEQAIEKIGILVKALDGYPET